MKELLWTLKAGLMSREEFLKALLKVTKDYVGYEIDSIPYILRGWCDAFESMEQNRVAHRIADLRADWALQKAGCSTSAEIG